MQPTQGLARVVRVGVLGTAALTLAASAHLLGGGRLPEPWVLLLVAVSVGTIATAVTATRCRFVPLVALLGGLQFVVHVLFGGLSTPLVHAPGGLSSSDYLAAAACGSLAPGEASHFGAAMIVGHGLATLATVALLMRGEAWVFSLADRAVRHAFARPNPLRAAAPSARILGVSRRPYDAYRYGSASPRGPPAWLIAR